jgi:Arc/MetJ-type ribon-helix-helix transcriptional regulator
MPAKVGKRIEVRLNEEYRRKLQHILECRDTTVSEFVREAIEAADREERQRILHEAFAYFDEHPLELPEDPEELRRELEETSNPFYGKPQYRKDFPWMFDD